MNNTTIYKPKKEIFFNLSKVGSCLFIAFTLFTVIIIFQRGENDPTWKKLLGPLGGLLKWSSSTPTNKTMLLVQMCEWAS